MAGWARAYNSYFVLHVDRGKSRYKSKHRLFVDMGACVCGTTSGDRLHATLHSKQLKLGGLNEEVHSWVLGTHFAYNAT